MPGQPGSSGAARRRPTIYDIAQAAGVSTAAVSLAMNHRGRLNADSERRILKVADALGYRANPFARAVATGSTKLIGLLVHDSANPVFGGAIRGVTDAASSAGYTVVVADTHDESTPVDLILERLLPFVDGVISCSTRVTPEVLAGAVTRPIVLVNREAPGYASVVPDVGAATRAAVRLLVEQGHRDLAFVAGHHESWLSAHRLAVLEAAVAMTSATLAAVVHAEPTIAGGRAALSQLEHRCSAILTFNDLIAFGVLLEARSRGLRVPGDLSVIGYDDTFAAALVTPPLTTISTELTEASRWATASLIATIANEPPERSTVPEGRLQVRESVGPPAVRRA